MKICQSRTSISKIIWNSAENSLLSPLLVLSEAGPPATQKNENDEQPMCDASLEKDNEIN